MNPGYGETVPYINPNSELIEPSGKLHPGPARYGHLTGIITECSKDHSTVLSNHMLQCGGDHGKTSEFHEH